MQGLGPAYAHIPTTTVEMYKGGEGETHCPCVPRQKTAHVLVTAWLEQNIKEGRGVAIMERTWFPSSAGSQSHAH